MRSRMVQTNGVTLRVTEAGEPGAPVVVLCHGFPELAFTWRHQVRALADAGFNVLAPDQRGYGGSDKPDAVDSYNVAELTADVVGLLDDLGAERAALVGHDFGAVVAWAAPLLQPDRFSSVAGLSLPPVPRPKVPTTQAFRRIFADRFFYILYFQDRGPADAELARDPAGTFRRLFAMDVADEQSALRMTEPGPAGFLDRIPDPGRLPDWISPPDFDVYVDEFRRGGFTAPLNWYRCFDLNWELTADPPAPTIEVPALFVGGTADATLAYTPRHRVREVVTGDYREVMIDGAGHWLTEERPDEVSRILLEFLTAAR
ncbi:alpha/beta hydrolase [Mycolicibacterium austroafricanum]|uniref:Alpha/beta hydrolase n=1 Tax=Mycolicibacterium austroafricanum TaxID=39687 RepID=A0ABT8HKM7_MYCAO|nr:MULTISPECIES: alpha/beta hydrolase [Mycolicibacterium]MDN4521310.1 alpha/beta hydrolase [Mycolicibacterium austroafricanum]MDW5611691.1 alpha/beta hydrolase [Mycolicibacterium sp. D5.8-2]PQP51802.1 epoxide hydrolase [Mycolicibacterium austroafricanum]QRZ06469.1 alpha/beta hydrolase [Mycolicibacterium austroafricanum]QZT67953.1 alpha/beta hydrolase [Mycolicibacterium austroafricanum]